MPPSLDEIRVLVMPVVSANLRGFPPSEVEDICQETWIACWQKLSCRPVDDWKAYCSQIARNKAATAIKSKRRREELFERMEATHLDNSHEDWELPTEMQILRAVYLIIHFFEEHRRVCSEIAILRFFESLAWDEVGRRMRSTRDAIKQQWHRCAKFVLERTGRELTDIFEHRMDDPEALR